MVCTHCGTRQASILVQTVVHNHLKKEALCEPCAERLEPAEDLDALMKALEGLQGRVRAHPSRCSTCRTSLANFRETGRLGCPNCYEHFLPQVKDLLPRVHAGAYQHRGKTPGRR